MKKFFVALFMLLTIPAFATGVGSTASTADCDNTTLNTYTGTSNLAVDWEANTIALHWYDGNEELTVPTESQSCTYDGILTPPSTIPTKTGNTFKGWKVRPDVPSGYTRLEYIESTGTQYIDTGVVPSEHLSFDCIFQVPYTPKPDGYGNVFGARASSGVQEYQLSLFNEGMVGIGGRNSLLGFANFNKHHILFDGNTSVNIDGIFTTIITSVISEPVGTIVMFAIRSNNSITQYEQTRIYKCSFGNVRNFIPAKRNSDGAIGMYDTVTKTFFTNAGTGSFIAGPVVQ